MTTTKRTIRPHKGGRTARAPEARIRPQTLERIHETMREKGKTFADLLEETYQGETEMLEVTVTNQATKHAVVVKINGYDTLNPESAIAARNVAQGSGNAAVSNGRTTYYVTKNVARKYNG